ncbi:hypothetical protein [Shimia isoporae]|nr:hypothetical protein [Shimia isoporae]
MLMAAYLEGSARNILGQGGMAASDARRAIIAELKKDDRDVIISAEELTQSFNKAAIERMVSDLREAFGQISAVAYIREPASDLVSRTQQIMRTTSSRSFEKVVRPREFQSKLSPWLKCLGAENVDLVPFEKDRLHEGDVVLDYCFKMGITPSQIYKTKHNVSPSGEAIILANHFHQLAEKKRRWIINECKYSAFARQLANGVLGFGQSQFSLAPELIESSLHGSAPDIDWLLGKLDHPFSPYVPPNNGLELQSSEHVAQLVSDIEEDFFAWWSSGVPMHRRARIFLSEYNRLAKTKKRWM